MHSQQASCCGAGAQPASKLYYHTTQAAAISFQASRVCRKRMALSFAWDGFCVVQAPRALGCAPLTWDGVCVAEDEVHPALQRLLLAGVAAHLDTGGQTRR